MSRHPLWRYRGSLRVARGAGVIVVGCIVVVGMAAETPLVVLGMIFRMLT